MLTSSSPYLHPDYLQPLPTTLDAKKSPLALLAQTCSSIGKDTTPSKPIIPPIERKKDLLDRQSCSPKSMTKHAEEGKNRPNSVKREMQSPSISDGFRTPAPKDGSVTSVSLPAGSNSPDIEDTKVHRSSPHREERERDRDTNSVSSKDGHSADHHASSVKHESSHDGGSNVPSTSNSQSSRSSVGPTSVTSATGHISTSKDSLYSGVLPSSLAGLPGCTSAALPGMLGPYGHFDPALAALHAAAKHGSPLAGSGAISPYNYTRVKTATGATTLVPVCKDPFCTNCQLAMQGAPAHSPHHLGSGTCSAGCIQCAHDKSPSAASAAALPPTSLASSLNALHGGLHLPGGLPSSSSSSASAAASSLSLPSSLFPPPFGIIPGQNHLLYVCNWVQAGSDYCGKRFATSEELLHHLRTHTAGAGGDMASFAAGLSAYHGLGLGAAASSAAAAAAAFSCHPYPPPPPSLSPNAALRQAYPGRSLSPNSLLAASRYHPYKSPYASAAGLPTAPSLSALPNPLGPYYSHYAALYGPRLGAAVAP